MDVSLLVVTILASDAGKVEFAGNVVFKDASTRLHQSHFAVQDSSGRTVQTSENAFQILDQFQTTISSGSFASSVTPRLPQNLPPGKYSAVWTLEGVSSNRARFEIGPGIPPFLSLERLKPDDECFVIHVFNLNAAPIIYQEALPASKLIVDGIPHARRKWSYMGSTALKSKHGRALSVCPKDFDVKLQGAGSIALEFAGQLSNSLALP